MDAQDKHWGNLPRHPTSLPLPAYLRDQYVKDLEYTDFPGTNLLDSLFAL